MTAVRRALVIGGGIAGPVAAVALQKAGIEAVIYEAHEGDAEGVGAFLGLGLNGIDALRAIDMDAPVLARGFATPRMVITTGNGRVLADFPNGGSLPDGTCAITITRPDLYAALREQTARRGIPTEHGKRLVDAQVTAGGVRAGFSDGSTAEGDLLVGADGIRSTARRLIDLSAPEPTYVGFLNTGGYARGVDVPGEPGVNYLVFGKRSFFGYIKHPNGDVWWFANPPAATEPDPAELAAVPPERWRAHLTELFAVDSTPALEAIRHTERIFAGWITYDLPSVPTWHNGPMVIIGDAAHAVSPSAGQGASMAIEDAVVLAKCLRDVPDLPHALTRYEQLRRGRVERVVAQGRRNGKGKTAGPVGRVVRDVFMPLAMRHMFRGGRDPLAWIWNHHIDWTTRIERTAQPRPVGA
ncbi:MAG TPA: NAD(P)/FAD-dependent oxidoreductase [Egibacteraceae bacterium]|nr:NAD(P)/FAD-dependent oxidoreductase [Egibacteraceae bacterium]